MNTQTQKSPAPTWIIDGSTEHGHPMIRRKAATATEEAVAIFFNQADARRAVAAANATAAFRIDALETGGISDLIGALKDIATHSDTGAPLSADALARIAKASLRRIGVKI